MAYTTIDDPTKFFDITLWTGDGGAKTITGLNHKPDLIWTKPRSVGYNHMWSDSSRGFNANSELGSNSTGLEGSLSAETYGYKSGHTADGWTMVDGTDSSDNQEDGNTNEPSKTYVGWTWAANGGTTASNSNGSITSTVQANTTAGFSIITYTGNATANATVGHGLSAAPQVYWCKGRTYDGGAINWIAEWSAFTSGSPNLNLDRAPINYSGDSPLMTAQATTITHTTARGELNDSGTHVIYCWTPIQGYSKFGSYTGNGDSTNGPFVYTGFKPAWIMHKRTDATGAWYMWDVKRALDSQGYFNRNDKYLQANSSGVQSTGAGFDFLSNGFRPVSTNAGYINASGGTYIYMAFAEHPFVSSEGVPTTAR